MPTTPSLPPGSTDTHMHIYEPGYPASPIANPPEPAATLADYRREMDQLGLTRTIIVQPSSYGTDNACTLAAIASLGRAARGVAILDEAVSEQELDTLTRQGIVGLRALLTSPAGMMSWDRLHRMAPRAIARGWNLNLQFPAGELAEREDFLRALPGQLVFDHLALPGQDHAADGPELAPLFRLLDTGRAWVKLSAPYQTGETPPYPRAKTLARRLIAHAPQRCLWATNWPHPGQAPRPSNASLATLLMDWAPDEATRHTILVTNPARLYGFDG